MTDCYFCQNGKKETRDHIDDLVGRYGFAIMAIGGHPSYCYTVGMWDRGLPEFITLGLSPRQGHEMLTLLVHHVNSFGLIALDHPFDDISTMPCKLVPVAERHRGYFRAALDHTQTHGNMVQLMWPDREGVFPDQANFSLEFIARQPSLR